MDKEKVILIGNYISILCFFTGVATLLDGRIFLGSIQLIIGLTATIIGYRRKKNIQKVFFPIVGSLSILAPMLGVFIASKARGFFVSDYLGLKALLVGGTSTILGIIIGLGLGAGACKTYKGKWKIFPITGILISITIICLIAVAFIK